MSKQEGELRCSFCGKSQHEVRHVIAGPGVGICDECVMLCVTILAPSPEERAALLASQPAEPLPAPTLDLDPEVADRIRAHLMEALGRIEAEEGVDTPLAKRIDISATPEGVRVDVFTSRPGTLIGAHGQTAEALWSGLSAVLDGYVALNVVPAPE